MSDTADLSSSENDKTKDPSAKMVSATDSGNIDSEAQDTTEPFDYSTLSPEQLTAYTLQYYQYYYPEYYAELTKPPAAVSAPGFLSSPFLPGPSTSLHARTLASSTMLPSAILPPPGASVGTSKGMRQMSHYFDYDAYVAQRNDASAPSLSASHTRLTKKDVAALKRKKQEKKKKKLLEWLRHD